MRKNFSDIVVYCMEEIIVPGRLYESVDSQRTQEVFLMNVPSLFYAGDISEIAAKEFLNYYLLFMT